MRILATVLFLVLSAQTRAENTDTPVYKGQFVLRGGEEAIADCKIIKRDFMISQTPSYYLAECGDASGKTKSLRLWHAQWPNEKWRGAEKDRPANLIGGEIILPWQKLKKDEYRMVQCEEKGNPDSIVGAFVRGKSKEVTKKATLILFRELENGEIERISFDRILPCFEPEP
jgi:hypothetical protein